MRDRSLAPKDKRVLVRFLQKCSSNDLGPDPEANVGFAAYLEQQHGLSPALCSHVLDCLTWLPRSASAAEGLQAMRLFLESLGVYAPTPFLVPVYGIGELSQAFCR